jgi:hypothetical protein
MRAAQESVNYAGLTTIQWEADVAQIDDRRLDELVAKVADLQRQMKTVRVIVSVLLALALLPIALSVLSLFFLAVS